MFKSNTHKYTQTHTLELVQKHMLTNRYTLINFSRDTLMQIQTPTYTYTDTHIRRYTISEEFYSLT